MLSGIQTKSACIFHCDNEVHDINSSSTHDILFALDTLIKACFNKLTRWSRQHTSVLVHAVHHDYGHSLPELNAATPKKMCTHAATLSGLGPNKSVVVDTPIVVDAGQVFDGKGTTFVPTKNIGDGGRNEYQKPVFIIEDGATLKNVNLSGGDGVHFLGNGTMINAKNKAVGEDAVTIDGPGNRAYDAFLSGSSTEKLPQRAQVKIINCTFDKANDKVIQDNAAADVTLNGIHVNGAATVFRTLGGDKSLDSNVTIKNSVLKNIRFVVFRTDAPDAYVTFQSVDDDAPYEVLAVHPSEQSSGAHRIGVKN